MGGWLLIFSFTETLGTLCLLTHSTSRKALKLPGTLAIVVRAFVDVSLVVLPGICLVTFGGFYVF